MANENAHPLESRTPTLEDLVTICRSLNDCGVKYLVVGGFAVIQHGYLRTTGDIDFLVEDSLENQGRVKKALEVLPDQAIRQLGEDDLRDWVVVRVADEVVVDLMTKACGINYAEAQSEIQFFTINGVVIPFASPKLLLRTKQTHRDKDNEDRFFLERKIAEGIIKP
jgi:hypothetical protein